MFPLILVLFLVVPIVELYVIVQVAGGIGVLETLGLLIVVSIVGAWLVKAEGYGVIRRVQAKTASGEIPGKELVDGALILFAGALMLTPGFVTDAVGLLLLLPPTRAIVRSFVMKRFSVMADAKVASFGFGPGTAGGQGPTVFGFGSSQVFDVDGHETDTQGPRRRPGTGTPPHDPEIVDITRDDDPSDEPPQLGR